jgi:uncharacterized protein (TIGR03067 family)
MPRRTLTAAALAALLLPLWLRADDAPAEHARPDEAAVDDLSELQGQWQVVAMQNDGRAVPENRWKNIHWLFEDDKVVQYVGAITCRQRRVRSDRTRTPPELVITYPLGSASCYVFRIRGDMLEVAASDSAEPPRGFTPDQGGDTVFVFRRVRR